MYGGTRLRPGRESAAGGLSPRVRGNRPQKSSTCSLSRSIPACTGEPDMREISYECNQVYPRVYGGTNPLGFGEVGGVGLSPRVRGNPFGLNPHAPGDRSIPACTGEPRTKRRLGRSRRVYPRVYGGTGAEVSWPQARPGLSPRVRGNPTPGMTDVESTRSIPACTGEPCLIGIPGGRGWVYPRVYGGTFPTTVRANPAVGLSPRVRGNQVLVYPHRVIGRSIPACTGEPLSPAGPASRGAVYPRVYGGTEGES